VVESQLALWRRAAEYLDQFRQDKSLMLLLGHELPRAFSPRA
jgi:hypothetical protein